MYLTVKQVLKHLTKEEYLSLKELSHIAKNLINEAIYDVRQYYFIEGEYLNYEKNYTLLKDSDNYKMLNSNMTQQILKEVDGSFKAFFGLLKLAKKGKYNFKVKYTEKQNSNLRNRNNKVNDYMNKTVRKIIDYCLDNDIGTIVVGYNETFQKDVKLGKRNNQTFLNIPYGKLREKLEYLCKLHGINFLKQEESYTSKASFFDKDIIAIYNDDNPKTYKFSGNRIKRGLYQTGTNKLINADINGALNILNKSKVVDLSVLYHRGEVDTPVRIRIA